VKEVKETNNACGTGGGCGCSETTAVFEDKFVARKAPAREIDIEFLYLDLEVCEQCKGSEGNLDEALREVSAVLEKTGVVVNLRKIHVQSLEQAEALQFISSPTIRVNGRDVTIEVKENYCSSCSELSGGETYCRVWNFQGEEFSTAPKSLVIEAILKEIYGADAGSESGETSEEQIKKSLENLKRFFAGRASRENTAELKNGSAGTATAETSLPQQTEQKGNSGGGCGCS
jgi:hypothetical protein